MTDLVTVFDPVTSVTVVEDATTVSTTTAQTDIAVSEEVTDVVTEVETAVTVTSVDQVTAVTEEVSVTNVVSVTTGGDPISIVGVTGTKAQFDTAVTDGNILYVGDVTQYTDEAAQDAVGAIVDSTLVYVDGTPLLTRAALTGAITAPQSSNTTSLGSFTVAELNSAISDADVGDAFGPASATDNAVARFNATTGKLLQNSAATIGDDGAIRSAINAGACAVAIPLTAWIMLTADYTLTSTTNEQKIFDSPTNGALTLPSGIYEFECFIYLTTMSATSGNAAFDPIGAGTAVTDRWGYSVIGVDNTTPLNTAGMTGVASVTQQTPASMVTATNNTALQAKASGMFRISTGGTVIPSLSLVTAVAAVVKAGSFFKIKKIGESSETYVGAWT